MVEKRLIPAYKWLVNEIERLVRELTQVRRKSGEAVLFLEVKIKIIAHCETLRNITIRDHAVGKEKLSPLVWVLQKLPDLYKLLPGRCDEEPYGEIIQKLDLTIMDLFEREGAPEVVTTSQGVVGKAHIQE